MSYAIVELPKRSTVNWDEIAAAMKSCPDGKAILIPASEAQAVRANASRLLSLRGISKVHTKSTKDGGFLLWEDRNGAK